MLEQSSLFPQLVAPHRYLENKTSNSGCQEKTLVFNKQHKRLYLLKIFPHCCEYQVNNDLPKLSKFHGKKRGNIKEFSKKSRFRLFQTLAKIKTDLSRNSLFITLTYHYGFENSENTFQEHLHNFLTKLRKFDTHVQYIWRLEFQKRGAPHFHFILFPGHIYDSFHHSNYINKVSLMWHKISDPNSHAHKKYGCLSKTIHNYREACRYLSKYVAKVDEDLPAFSQIKHYGQSRKLPIAKAVEIELTEDQAYKIIENIRRKLFRMGSQQYSNSIYFNYEFSQFIFTDKIPIYEILNNYGVYPNDS